MAMKTLELRRRNAVSLFCKVDDSDFEWLNQWKWRATKNGNTAYCSRTVASVLENGKRKYKSIMLHRFILGCPSGMLVDHVNGDGLDNRRENLRICTNSQNLCNAKPKEGKKYRGVDFHKRSGTWRATCKHNGKTVFRKHFKTEEEAAVAYAEAASRAHGDFYRKVEIK